ncbi:Alcohol acetyltransferase [Exserohilum turcicum]
MDISQLKKIRALGKLEEMAAVAHALDLYITAGFSVHYKASQALKNPDVESLIYHAVRQVLIELPMMFAVPIIAEGEETYFARLPFIDLRTVISFAQRQNAIVNDGKGRDIELDVTLQQQVNTNVKSDQGIVPVWRLVILYDSTDKQQFTANFMVHHAIADGASFQILHRAFHKALHGLSLHSGMPSQVEYIASSKNDDAIGPPLEAIHSLQIAEEAPQTDAPKYNDWLGNITELPNKTGYATLTLSQSMVQAFTRECRKNKVSAPAGLNALITKTLYL